MGAHSGPNITEDGLVLYLDAGNANSYSGSGTTWYDLSGKGNHGQIDNFGDSPSFTSSFGGAFDFAGSKRFYIDIQELNNTSSYTVIWSGIDGSGDRYSGVSRDILWQTGNHLIGWQTGAINSDSGRDTNTNSTGDEFVVCHVNNTSTKTVSQYLNGIYYGDFTYTNWESDLRWSFGCRGDGSGHQYTGKMCTVQLYNRMLSENEIKRNYHAIKSRIGLQSTQQSYKQNYKNINAYLGIGNRYGE